ELFPSPVQKAFAYWPSLGGPEVRNLHPTAEYPDGWWNLAGMTAGVAAVLAVAFVVFRRREGCRGAVRGGGPAGRGRHRPARAYSGRYGAGGPGDDAAGGRAAAGGGRRGHGPRAALRGAALRRLLGDVRGHRSRGGGRGGGA